MLQKHMQSYNLLLLEPLQVSFSVFWAQWILEIDCQKSEDF